MQAPSRRLDRLASCMQEWIADTEALEEVQIMEEVPHTLRREISFACNRKIFMRLGIFHDFPIQEQQSIAAMMTPLQVGICLGFAAPRHSCLVLSFPHDLDSVTTSGVLLR